MRTMQTVTRLMLAASTSAAAHARIDRAEINGTVTDTSGAATPSITVNVTQEGTDATCTVATSASRHFIVSALTVGRFSGR